MIKLRKLFVRSFNFNLELHLVEKRAGLTTLKHEALDPLCHDSAGTGQASCLPTCCPTNAI